VLANAERPCPPTNFNGNSTRRFQYAFGENSIIEIERCLRQHNLFIRNAQGEYMLDKHLERDEAEAADIRQTCLEILSSDNRILGTDDIIERLAAEGTTTENLANGIHNTMLQDNALFEIGTETSIQADEHSH
jgi:hypothetical protein